MKLADDLPEALPVVPAGAVFVYLDDEVAERLARLAGLGFLLDAPAGPRAEVRFAVREPEPGVAVLVVKWSGFLAASENGLLLAVAEDAAALRAFGAMLSRQGKRGSGGAV